MAPSTFASAAAGNNANSSRTDSDWARRANGATQTFRRSSHATSFSTSSASRDQAGNPAPSNPGVYVPPHVHSNRNSGGYSNDTRYGKDHLLEIFRAQKEGDHLSNGLSTLFVPGWQPSIANGASTASWGRREEHDRQNQPGADICWDRDGTVNPMGLSEPTDEEREIFNSSVNSPLKPPTQTATKDGNSKDNLNLRKTSISHQALNSPGAFGLSSPTGSRSTRRRDTSDAYPFPNPVTSPSTSRFPREETSSAVTPPPSLIRRRTDLKDPPSSEDKDKEKSRDADAPNPFGSLKRTTTAPFAGAIGSPTSPWSAGPQSAGFGVFGNFAIGTGGQVGPTNDKRLGFGSLKGESRFKGLMAKDSAEDISRSMKEKGSSGTLARAPETESSRDITSWLDSRSKRTPADTEEDLVEDDLLSGSAALGGQDASPPRRQTTGFGTPSKPDTRDDGFSAFGMTSDNTGVPTSFVNRENYQQQTPQSRLRGAQQEPLSSPTTTNPYHSPENDRTGGDHHDAEGSDDHNTHLPGLGGFDSRSGQSGLLDHSGVLRGGGAPYQQHDTAASDRSQTSSVGANRGIPDLGSTSLAGLGGGLPGLGGPGLPSWPIGTAGVPSGRDRLAFGAFGDPMFGSGGDLHSPSIAGLGPSNGFGPGSGTIGRSSKMGSLFPAAMQEQMRTGDHNRHGDDVQYEAGERAPIGQSAYARNAFGAPGSGHPARDSESPFRGGRSNMEEFDNNHRNSRDSGSLSDTANTPFGISSAQQNPQLATQGSASQLRNAQSQNQGVSSSASNQPPAAQQRTMVMPDRMRWIYRDPQGATQGPWSGLEMHDWYKAGFFSPELLVKKAEDPEYEPLAQLIRRIGNSREPFLVPQIGIPHGPAPAQSSTNQWPGTGTAPGTQPPFANSFPSFGTTLTAEQQNALERRKQEEQWLMARQKEHLAQQQVIGKSSIPGLNQHGILTQQLHHHSSAHSLHSQPSFGSITSPGGYQPSPTQGAVPGSQGVPGFFDNSFRTPSQMPSIGVSGAQMDMLGNIREEQLPGMMDRLNLRTNQPGFGGVPAPYGNQQQPDSNNHEQVAAMLNDRSRLQREQAEHDAKHQNLSQHDQDAIAQASAERLRQFYDLQSQSEADQGAPASEAAGSVIGKTSGSSADSESEEEGLYREDEEAPATDDAYKSKTEPLSLTEQVQKTASAKQTPVQQSPWAKIDTSMPHPFPPPVSQSPLPAPSAQRKQNLADALTAETRSQTATPSVETPSASIAPWAKEPAEAPKGPSLREIQEAEAKQAAQKEELAANTRRIQQERELQALTNAPAPAPGLPSSSTWASGASPLTPSSATAASPWAKTVPTKTPAQIAAAAKKTLAQIQKEEEARKLRTATTLPNTVSASAAPLASGKRYADLASKQAGMPPNVGGSVWTTVGASGKTKTPVTSTPSGPASVLRTASASIVPGTSPKPKPASSTANAGRSMTTGGPIASTAHALEEVRKWAIAELKKDLEAVPAGELVATLPFLPMEVDFITETVHSVSKTIDSRHFAEEYLKRYKLAQKGIIESSSPSNESKSAESGKGGWSEVAKKGGSAAPAKEEPAVNFKVVASKKKGTKR
ncbi:hypothetical protein EJ05DRAFT_484306 [Pseudovirgaria hyperparasitica]|uniref:GYF domain-containing protein n=1 Tax=Pseudovirgaria hyperparasitica TaxID=470096 RepID=A0A6A6WFD6_9PEZI|nr:uncharacterized protein EJ05DRAFT_484306 [Pseudovirgaria hyperparasitica]KAF2760596.1 hypothetical protein EJ05DRAFT_484306 [Pseudovirgaria hyperparasitica]